MIKTSRQVVLCLLDLSEPQQYHPVSSQSTRRWEIRSQEDLGISKSQKTINKKIAELKQMLDESPEVLTRLQLELTDHCKRQGIERFETPAKLIFVKEIWTPDTGLVTDSLKLKRKQLEQFYAAEISAAYCEFDDVSLN